MAGKSETKVSEGPRGDSQKSFLTFSSFLFQLLVTSCVPWLVAVDLNVCLCLHMAFFSPCLPVFFSVSPKDTCPWIRALQTIQDELISKSLTQLPLQRPFTQIRLYSQVLGSEHIFRDASTQPTTMASFFLRWWGWRHLTRMELPVLSSWLPNPRIGVISEMNCFKRMSL